MNVRRAGRACACRARRSHSALEPCHRAAQGRARAAELPIVCGPSSCAPPAADLAEDLEPPADAAMRWARPEVARFFESGG
eukprot:5758144-Prymnesium_polylepis.1